MKHLALIITLSFSSLTGNACDCIMHHSVEAYVESVGQVFIGEVIELLDSLDDDHYSLNQSTREHLKNKRYTAKVRIVEYLKKGELEIDILVFTSDFTNCDPLYELGESYLFFAEQQEDEKFKMVHCTPWGTLKESQKSIRRLKKILRTNG